MPFRPLPGLLLRRLVQSAFFAVVARSPRRALRTLLEIEDDLSICINQVALRYGDGVHVKHRLMRYHDFFVERIRAGERVLDIGCGYGAVAYSVASRTGATVLGIDLNTENIALARKKFQHPNLKFVEGDVLKDLPEEPFDAIVFSNVLEHIEHRVEFLRKGQERLKPQRWLIRVPMFNRDWRVPLRQELGMFYFSDSTHFTEYTRESFEKEMEEAGLTVTHLEISWGEIWAEVRRDA